jgi:hypothetical protein
MRHALALLALLLATTPASAEPAQDHPRSYLLSLKGLPVGKITPRLTGFHFDTWGVIFYAVCRIPSGWHIKAGSSASPDGEIEGEASQGVTNLNRQQLAKEGPLLLVKLYGPVQRKKINFKDGNGGIPATFTGKADIAGFGDDNSNTIPLTYANIRLTPARQCPPLPRR